MEVERLRFIKEQEETPTRMRAFFETLRAKYAGRRVILVTLLAHLYDVAAEGLANGVSGVFAPDSLAQIQKLAGLEEN